ncbi:MAG: phosphatase PAP2 family protein [Burkholderiaceae bacterium]
MIVSALYSLDLFLLDLINQLAGNHYLTDKIVLGVSDNHLFKGGVIITLFWVMWFSNTNQPMRRRRQLAATLGASAAAIVAARGLANLLPFRSRPIHNPLIEVNAPLGMGPEILEGWTSFPSDHAVLFYTLGVGIWFASRKIGLIVLVYITVVIALPRIYLGLHYPTDIIFGGVVGCLFAIGANFFGSRPPGKLTVRTEEWLKRYPGIGYGAAFVITFQLAELFESTRYLARQVSAVIF